MSTKNLNKKSDNNNNRAEEQALKDAEIVAELAPNERTRKEAEELIERVQVILLPQFKNKNKRQ